MQRGRSQPHLPQSHSLFASIEYRQQSERLEDQCHHNGGNPGPGYSTSWVSPCNSEVHSAPAFRRNSHLIPLSGLTFRRLLVLFTVFLYQFQGIISQREILSSLIAAGIYPIPESRSQPFNLLLIPFNVDREIGHIEAGLSCDSIPQVIPHCRWLAR